MSGVAVVMDDLDVTQEDPHGLGARMAALGLLNKDVAERLDIAPNTVTRAIRTAARSDARPRIEALLSRLEQEQEPPGPGSPRRLDQLVGDSRLVDVRIEYIGGGRVQRLVALLVDSDLTPEQVEREIREWRRGYKGPE